MEESKKKLEEKASQFELEEIETRTEFSSWGFDVDIQCIPPAPQPPRPPEQA